MVISKLKPIPTMQENLFEELKKLIPEAISESKINWEVLKELLGEHLEDENEVEHFGLNWAGKRQARRLASVPSKGTLKPVVGEGVDEENTGNIFIEGDNLEVLKLLQKSYAGRIKMIYIDPPYNTGNNFIYKDNYKESLDDYLRKTGQVDEEGNLLTSNPKSGGRYHSNWLNMMYPRLKLARNLLKEDGVILISIDDNEVAHLRQVCDEIFGEENFIDPIIWKKRYGGGAKEKYLVALHEYTLFYSKSKTALDNLYIPLEEESIKRYYKSKDNNFVKRGPYRTHPLEAMKSFDKRENLYFPITAPNGDEVYPKRQWRWSKERVQLALQNQEIEFSQNKNGNWTLSSKQYLKDDNGEIRKTKPFSIIDNIYTQHGTNEFVDIFGNAKIFDFPKPSALLCKLITIGLNYSKNDIVLDFFCGSATAAHAAINLNKEDGGERKFIMIQIPELCEKGSEAYKSGYESIAEIGKERIRRVIKQIKEEQQSQLELLAEKKQDLGFKVYKLDKSNLKIWENHQDDNLQTFQASLLDFENPLIDGWKEEDVVAEIQLIEGFPLDSKIEQADVFTGNRVLEVASDLIGHKLFICLENKLKPETVEQVKSLASEDIFICLDNALTDEAKLQLADSCNVKAL